MPHEEEAKRFCAAIKKLAENPSSLDNMESYLSRHFAVWMKLYANCPENICGELENFASIA